MRAESKSVLARGESGVEGRASDASGACVNEELQGEELWSKSLFLKPGPLPESPGEPWSYLQTKSEFLKKIWESVF